MAGFSSRFSTISLRCRSALLSLFFPAVAFLALTICMAVPVRFGLPMFQIKSVGVGLKVGGVVLTDLLGCPKVGLTVAEVRSNEKDRMGCRPSGPMPGSHRQIQPSNSKTKEKISMSEPQQDEIAKELIAELESRYSLPRSKTFTAAVTSADSPGNARLIVREQPYIFVDERAAECHSQDY